MPSKNMIRKGKRRQTVKPAYRAHREATREAAEAAGLQAEAELLGQGGPPADPPRAAAAGAPASDTAGAGERPVIELHGEVRSVMVPASARGKRLDAFLARAMPEISRARVQLLIEGSQVQVDGRKEKASYKLEGGERIAVEGEPQPAPLKAEAEDIPLSLLYEDDDLAVIEKPAGMMVHAGAGDAEHNRGTLVNALLFHLGARLSSGAGAAVPRPGIVHRLDKETSGLLLVAKNDVAHRQLADLFATRSLTKTYIALVHGTLPTDEGTVDLPVGRDPVRRTRMTTRRSLQQGARSAVSHWRVLERVGSKAAPGEWGTFTLVEITIETGRTHQIRVHMAALGYPVVGDTLYGAPARLKRPGDAAKTRAEEKTAPSLPRNFLHAARLRLPHPRTGMALDFESPLPSELQSMLETVRGEGRSTAAAALVNRDAATLPTEKKGRKAGPAAKAVHIR